MSEVQIRASVFMYILRPQSYMLHASSVFTGQFSVCPGLLVNMLSGWLQPFHFPISCLAAWCEECSMHSEC